MHELMTKYMRRLDHELHKFKMELEADNSGITGLIEKSKLISLLQLDLLISIKNLINFVGIITKGYLCHIISVCSIDCSAITQPVLIINAIKYLKIMTS